MCGGAIVRFAKVPRLMRNDCTPHSGAMQKEHDWIRLNRLYVLWLTGRGVLSFLIQFLLDSLTFV